MQYTTRTIMPRQVGSRMISFYRVCCDVLCSRGPRRASTAVTATAWHRCYWSLVMSTYSTDSVINSSTSTRPSVSPVNCSLSTGNFSLISVCEHNININITELAQQYRFRGYFQSGRDRIIDLSDLTDAHGYTCSPKQKLTTEAWAPQNFFQGWTNYESGDESPPVGSRDGAAVAGCKNSA